MKKMNKALLDFLVNYMTINFDVFGTLMKYIIMRNLYGTSIIAMTHRGRRMNDTQIN